MPFGTSAFGIVPFGQEPVEARQALQILRRAGSGAPSEMYFGEPAYSDAEPRLYIGNSDGTHSTFVDKTYVDAATAPQPGARVYSTVQFLVPTNSIIPVPFDSERYDTGNVFNAATYPTRLFAPSDGVYHVGAHVMWDYLAAPGEVGLTIRLVSPSSVIRQVASQNQFGPEDYAPRISLATIHHMVAGEYAELLAFNFTAANQYLLIANTPPGRFQWLQEFYLQRRGDI